jgi:AraC family transcriptional regulator
VLGAEPIEPLEADGVVRTLLLHIAVRYLGARAPRPLRGRQDRRRLARVAEFIDASLHAPPSLREMADVAAMSPFHFQRVFRLTTGLTPHAYVSARRMERARRMLGGTATTVAGVAAALGFSDVAHFRRSFHRVFNAPPRAMRGRTVS